MERVKQSIDIQNLSSKPIQIRRPHTAARAHTWGQCQLRGARRLQPFFTGGPAGLAMDLYLLWGNSLMLKSQAAAEFSSFEKVEEPGL